jgi:flagellar basal-body rod protein FlgF/flagellar basal-body rod protein FlgG
MEALDTIASNVANSGSTGFRGQENVFGTVLAEAQHHGRISSLNQATNTFSQSADPQLDQQEGTLTHTGNDLDVAIQGAGFFKVQTANGVAYTRNGRFRVDANGRLATESGEAVLGQNGPIVPGKGPITISADGTISSNGAVAGKIALVTFAPGTQITSRGNAEYAAPAANEKPAMGSTIEQGALEGSNVSPIEGVVQLIGAQRAAESMRHALTLLDSDMDKTAAQELPRTN